MDETPRSPGIATDLRRIAALLESYRERLSGKAAVPASRAPADVPGEDSPAELLARVFGLSAFERDVLLLCAAMELDSGCAALISDLQAGRPPDFSLALAALPDAYWSALLPTAPLRYWRLIETGAGPSLVTRPLHIDERILHLLLGLQHMDERLAPIVAVATPPAELVPSHRAIAEHVAALWRDGGDEGAPFRVVQLSGPDLSAQREVAATACALAGSSLLVLHSRDLPETAEALERIQRLWEREALLVGAALMIVCDRAEGEDGAADRRLEKVIERTTAPLIVSTPNRRPPGERPMLTFEVARPTPSEQMDVWREALGEASPAAETDLSRLVFQFDLDLTAIRAASTDARGAGAFADRGDAGASDVARVLWHSCRRQGRGRLEGVVQRIEPSAGWDDLVLPERERQILAGIVEQERHRATVYGDWGFAAKGARGLGIAALFAGPSGTGKTLAAEVLASELELDLYRIDLSAVVNKYVGETEKNLRRVFDSAEAGGAILLFDEADALFGKRSDVKDSHDRYANIEVSYLLQRIESYRGLAILTTNLKDSIDQAFLRRLRFVVQFPFPDAALRRDIWRRVFPPQTPLERVDFDRLAQLNITGGSIRNIALNAAFPAAGRGSGVTMDDLRRAAMAEYAKLEKTLTEAETRGWE